MTGVDTEPAMRWLNRVIAVIFGLALAAAGALVVWESVGTVLEPTSRRLPYEGWMESHDALRWDSPEVLSAGAGMAVLGLIVLALQVVPRRPSALGAASGGGGTEVKIDRSALERALSRAATGVEGVTGARTRARRRKITTKVDVPGGGDRAVVQEVEGVLQNGLERLGVKPSPRVSVSSRARGRAR